MTPLEDGEDRMNCDNAMRSLKANTQDAADWVACMLLVNIRLMTDGAEASIEPAISNHLAQIFGDPYMPYHQFLEKP
jgi:hypothetical protein